jgi:alpha-1,2-mannosyltransferase
MPVRSLAIYVIHATTFVVALALVHRWHVRGTLENGSPRNRYWLAGLLGVVNLLIAEPVRSPFQDFYAAYYQGGAAVVSGSLDFRELFKSGVHGFVNLPILAWVFAPLGVLPKRIAALLFFGLGLLVCLWAYRILCVLAQLDRYRAALLGALMLTNGPLMNSLKEGNTSHFALLALVWAFQQIQRGRSIRAGAVIGFAALFKLPLLLYGLWALLRWKVRVLLGGVITIVGLGLLSVLFFGTEIHQIWFDSMVNKSATAPLGAFNVQSFAATFVRWQHPTETLCNWNGMELTPTWRRAASGIGVGLLALGLVANASPRFLRGRSTRAPAGELIEFATVALLACVLSPLSWSHYYSWLLIPFALALSSHWDVLVGPSTARRRLAWALVFLGSLPVVWPWCEPRGALAPFYLVFVSHYLGTAVVVFLALLWARVASARPGELASK